MDLRVTNGDLRIERVRLTPMLMCAKASGNEWAACYPDQGIFGEMCLFECIKAIFQKGLGHM